MEICLYCSKLMRKGYWKKKAYNFIKKETPSQVFFCKFCEIFKITFLYWLLSVFEHFIYMSLYYETQIKSRVLPFKKQNRGNLNNQITPLFWNVFLLNVDIWLFKLRMRACKISITAIGKTCSISCLSFALIVNYWKNF